MNNQSTANGEKTMASIQLGIDIKMFAQSPVHIIERYLDYFNSDGEMTSQVPKHILEAIAVPFRDFFHKGSTVSSLNNAFGGKVARQRQARETADKQFEVAFLVICERKRLQSIKKSERGSGTPHEIACENVAEELKMSVDNVREIYKRSQSRKSAISG